MPLWAGAALGGLWVGGMLLAWSICRAAGIADDRMARMQALLEREERLVGFCSECGGPVVLSRDRSVASCPSGCSTIPGAFFLTARGHG